MTYSSDWENLWLFILFLLILIPFLVFVSSRYFIVFQFKIASLAEKWRIRRLKNKKRRANERFKQKIKNFISGCLEKEIGYLNNLMDKNDMLLSLGRDRYFDSELIPETSGLLSLTLFRPYSAGFSGTNNLPEIKRVVESEIKIDFNNSVVHYQLRGDDQEKLIKGLVLEEAVKAAIIISKEYIVKSYRLRRIDQLV